jgi:D-3-phosphoglycerate dehydrogenase
MPTNARVIVAEPSYDLALARGLLAGVAEVEARDPPWAGEEIVGLLVGPDQPVGERELEALPGLVIVATCSVGYDHVDVEAAERRGVWVANVPDYCVEEMADSSLAMLLALLRGIVVLDRSVRAGGWDHRAAGELRRLADTRLGIVGFGRIGRALAARAIALGMEVWATDPLVPAAEVEAAGVRAAEVGELLRACNAVSLHAPLTAATEGLIGERELAAMPPGAVLVDTARARLVDFDAVLSALDSGHLAAAAFDVLPVEPPSDAHPAPTHPRLVVNPHAAWYSAETETEVYRRPILAVREALEGSAPRDAVTRPRTAA